jgi:hypothetical protein
VRSRRRVASSTTQSGATSTDASSNATSGSIFEVWPWLLYVLSLCPFTVHYRAGTCFNRRSLERYIR